jgi:hypothetical protein
MLRAWGNKNKRLTGWQLAAQYKDSKGATFDGDEA